MPKHQRMLFSGWLFIVFICFSAGGFASNPEPGHHRILLLFSYHPEFPTTDKVIAGIHSVFPQGSVELDIEFMDSKRLYDAEMQSRFLRLLQYKLAHRKPYDVVVSADDNALNFLLSHRRHVLSDTPIVFLGVNNVQLAIDQDQVPDVTGVVEASSFRDTLTMMTTLFPGRKRLNVLVDPTPSGQADLQTLKGVQTDFPMLEVQERSLGDLTWDEWGQSLAMLDQNDMVLLLAAYRDRTGEARSFEEGLQLTMASLNQVPVFHLWEHGVGDGILGGTLVSHFQQGREAALMVQRIFLGEPVRDIAVLRKSPNVPTFDYDVMRQFSLSVDDVGSRARIINKPEVWRQYQDYFLVALMMLGILAVFTLLLLRSHARITLEKSLLKALIDSIPDVIFFKNQSRQYLGCNKAFEAITGFTERHITGQHQQFVVNQELDELFSIDDQQVLTSRRTVRKEAWFEFSQGRRILLDVVKTPYFDPKGKLLGLIAICRDVTDRYYSEARLARSKELLTNAQQLAHIGSWELSVSSLNFECTRELFNIFGLENAEATVGREDFIDCLLPKDREELISAYQRVLVEHEPINHVHSIVTPSGLTKYVHSQINVEFNKEQVPIRVYGTVQDMTEHRLTDERIRQAATVFEHAAEAIVLTDANSVIVDVNDAFEKITGYHRDEVLGKTPGLLKSGKHDELFYAAMWQDIKSQGNWQ
ncbi:MAG: PAS domain S-box protein, partial [Pseudomonadales bacterium]|nr:PAS domain S-box protein [Pseudomonadales bacterium]